MITEQQLPHLIKLLDDSDPAIQKALQQEFEHCSGDLSHLLAANAIDIPAKDQETLSKLLMPSKRHTLLNEWQIPAKGVAAISDDWEKFEHHLRLISDFLHDGITLRPSLPDIIDMIADEAEHDLPDLNADTLRKWMFQEARYRGNEQNFYLPNNSDLCWVADHGLGNPLSLASLFMLVGQRFSLDITGCNYPAHFLARIYIDGKPFLVDCFHQGRLLDTAEILENQQQISLAASMAVQTHASLGHILWRFLRNLEYCFQKTGSKEDAQLFEKLAQTMQ